MDLIITDECIKCDACASDPDYRESHEELLLKADKLKRSLECIKRFFETAIIRTHRFWQYYGFNVSRNYYYRYYDQRFRFYHDAADRVCECVYERDSPYTV